MSDGVCLMNVFSSARETVLFDPTTVRNAGQRSTSNGDVRDSYVLCVQQTGVQLSI